MGPGRVWTSGRPSPGHLIVLHYQRLSSVPVPVAIHTMLRRRSIGGGNNIEQDRLTSRLPRTYAGHWWPHCPGVHCGNLNPLLSSLFATSSSATSIPTTLADKCSGLAVNSAALCPSLGLTTAPFYYAAARDERREISIAAEYGSLA